MQWITMIKDHTLIFRNSKCGGMATHAGLALELGIVRKKSLSPQMEAILIWCQCRTREYEVQINVSKALSRHQEYRVSLILPPVLFRGHSMHCFPILGFHSSLGWRSGFLCTYPQFLPQCIRLQITENRDTCWQEKELWACIRNWREVCRSAWLPDCRGHVRDGGGEEDRPQDDLLLRPGGLQDVQWAVIGVESVFIASQCLKEPHDDVSEDDLRLLTFKMLLIFLI